MMKNNKSSEEDTDVINVIVSFLHHIKLDFKQRLYNVLEFMKDSRNRG
jgi:hypothetical protein